MKPAIMKRYVEQYTNHRVVKLGSGTFATAFRSLDDDTVVFIVTRDDDHVKEIISHVDNKYVPSMNQIEIFNYGHYDYTVWQTTYSDKPLKSHGLAYQQWQTLSKLWDSMQSRFFRTDKDMWYSVVADFIDALRETDIDPELIDALDHIDSWASAFGPNYRLEFPRNNVGVTPEGRLQLRDIIFFR